MFKNRIRLVALAVVLMWAALWGFFAIASSMAEPGGAGIDAFVAVCLFSGSALAACLWDRIGGALLLVEGVMLCIANFTFLHNPPATQLFLLLTLVLPPLAAGTLLLTARPRPHPHIG